MAWLSPPVWLENADNHNAVDYRTMLASLVGGSSGVAAGGHLQVSPRPTPNMSVDVAPGGVFVASTRSAAQGVYHAYNDGTINVPIAAADPTNPRIDRIVVQVRDEAQDPALTQNDVRVTVVQGTPAASPSAPAVPFADYVILAEVRVNAAATSITLANITDRRARASIAGGTQVVTSSTRPASPSQGQQIYEADTDRILIFNGGDWVGKGIRWAATNILVGSNPSTAERREAQVVVQAGTQISSSGAGGGYSVTFPSTFTGLFSVVATLASGDVNANLVISTKNHSTSGFDVVIRTNAGAVPSAQNVRINYVAVGW